jgi:hypothetical protein
MIISNSDGRGTKKDHPTLLNMTEDVELLKDIVLDQVSKLTVQTSSPIATSFKKPKGVMPDPDSEPTINSCE